MNGITAYKIMDRNISAKAKTGAMYNKLVSFLYEINNRYLNDNFPKELRDFISAGNKLRDALEKKI